MESDSQAVLMDFELLEGGILRLGQRETVLTVESAALLRMLLATDGFVSMEEILLRVCGIRTRTGGDRVRQLVRRTRLTLGEHAWHLTSRKGLGYRWIQQRHEQGRVLLLTDDVDHSLRPVLREFALLDVHDRWPRDVESSWQLCVADLPPTSATRAVRTVRKSAPHLALLVLCDPDDSRTRQTVVRLGASYVTRPVDASMVAAFVRAGMR